MGVVGVHYQNYSAWNEDDSNLYTGSATYVLPSPSTIFASTCLTGFWNYFTNKATAGAFISSYTKLGSPTPIIFSTPLDSNLSNLLISAIFDSNVESVTYAIELAGSFAYALFTLQFWE